MTEPQRCRCHLELSPKPPEGLQWWWPDTDSEPGLEVRAVVRYGANPLLFRIIRTSEGWREQGELSARPWSEVGLCWAGKCHLVVQTTIV